ncbi:hypothetical protein ABK040_016541 [Willaertia magna]
MLKRFHLRTLSSSLCSSSFLRVYHPTICCSPLMITGKKINTVLINNKNQTSHFHIKNNKLNLLQQQIINPELKWENLKSQTLQLSSSLLQEIQQNKELSITLQFENKTKIINLKLNENILQKTLLELFANENFFKNEISEMLSCSINKTQIFDLNDTLLEVIYTLQSTNLNFIKFHTFNEEEGKSVFWHSSSHLLGYALENYFLNEYQPQQGQLEQQKEEEEKNNGKVNIQLSDGPPLNPNDPSNLTGGFFYESFLSNNFKLSQEIFEKLENFINLNCLNVKDAKNKLKFEKKIITKEIALQLFKDNDFKLEILNKLKDDELIKIYKYDNFIDLCRGPHLPSSNFIKVLKLNRVGGVNYKLKKENNEIDVLLQRIYGISFPKLKLYEEYCKNLEEALQRDHRVISRKQGLFFFHEYSPGSPFFLPHGTILFNKLMQLIRKEYLRREYQEVITPQLFNKDLWMISGHWDHYKEDMFVLRNHHHHKAGANQQHSGCCGGHHGEEDNVEEIGIKPMNCPGHCLMFASSNRSYKDLPIRYADFSPLHRNEPKGSLTGLTRVIRFHQDDSHIFCTNEQIKEEIAKCLEFIEFIYKKVFKFELILNLSTRPEKYVGELEVWNEAESALKQSLNDLNLNWKLNEGDGAFYGPKIDIQIKDSLNRLHQCATVQLDFQLPKRFQLKYQDKNDQYKTPVIIHRAVLGSIERFIALLTEHLNGKWPFWLNPRQCYICPISTENVDLINYCEKVKNQLVNNYENNNYIIDVDINDKTTLKKKIREAQLLNYNFIIVLGEKELTNNTVNVRRRDGTVVGEMTCDELLNMWGDLIKNFE